MSTEDLRKRIEVLREQRAWIDNASSLLESQLEALELQKRAKEKGTEIIDVKPARGGGSYVQQKVKCGKPSCHCAKPGGELHGPYWYLYSKKGGKSTSKYVGRASLLRLKAEAEILKDQARLEDLQIWQMVKEKTTKKGSRTYAY